MRITTALLLSLLVVSVAAQNIRRPGPPEKTVFTDPVRLPFTFDGHLPVVEVKINGEGPFRFALDTGLAGQITIGRDLATKLKLEKVGEARTSDPSGQNPQTRDVVRMDSLELGGARFEGVSGTVRPGNLPERSSAGILGYALFHELLLTLDYPKKELRLDRGALPEPNGKDVLALVPRMIPAIELTIGGRTIVADIDAGSPAMLTLPLGVAKELPLKGEPRVVGKGSTISGPFEVFGAELKGDVTIGPRTLHDPMIDMVERFPRANLGHRFLRDFAVTFDAKNGRVAFR